MNADLFFVRVVDPCLQYMAVSPSIAVPVTPAARVLTMAIAGQEGGWAARRQIGGPARSYWQFEKGGGVAEVMQKTPNQLKTVCTAQDVPYDAATIFEAMAWNDPLGCAMARLLLWQDPHPLPAVGDKEGAWQYYLRNWRPGAPHRASWDARYDQSTAAIGAKP